MGRRSPRPAWQLLGCVQILLASGCAGSLPVQWVRAQPCGVPTHSRILMGPFQLSTFCGSTIQSLPVPPSISWSHICLPQVLGASWWLGWAQGAFPFISHPELQRGFSCCMDTQGKTQEEGPQANIQGLGREAVHPTVFPGGSWVCVSLLELWQENFWTLFPFRDSCGVQRVCGDAALYK